MSNHQPNWRQKPSLNIIDMKKISFIQVSNDSELHQALSSWADAFMLKFLLLFRSTRLPKVVSEWEIKWSKKRVQIPLRMRKIITKAYTHWASQIRKIKAA